MDEKTRIFNEDFEESFGDGETGENRMDDEDQLEDNIGSGSSTPGYVSLGVGVAAGLGAGIFGAHMAYGNFSPDKTLDETSPLPDSSFLAKILVKANTPIATGIPKEMSLDEAYAFARDQVGPGGVFVWDGAVYGTYKEEEWTSLTEEQQNDYYSSFNLMPEATEQPLLFDDVQLSTKVNDDMTFGEAFGAARSELGAGGVFLWEGSAYNTFYKEEWAAMSPAEQNDFIAAYLDIETVDLVPTAETFDPGAGEDGEHYSIDREATEGWEIEDIPIANALNVGNQYDHEAWSETETVFEPQPIGDEGFISEIEAAKTFSPDGDFTAFNPDISKDDFIHSFMYNGQNANQQFADNEDDILPDNLVSGLEGSDDSGI